MRPVDEHAAERLRARLWFSSRAIELAGGHAEFTELLESRVRAFCAERAPEFEIAFTDTTIALFHRKPEHQLILLGYNYFREWQEAPQAGYDIEGIDIARSILPYPEYPVLPADDPFRVIFTQLRDLMMDWPEAVPAPTGLAA